MSGQAILYQYRRSKVERGDFSHFLALYAPDELTDRRRLREMMNGVIFVIEGWDDDLREIRMIPEIRRFYKAFHAARPYCLNFCNLQVDTLRAMTMCCLPSINVMQAEGQIKVAVNCDPLDLLHFLNGDFIPMSLMCGRSGIFEKRIYNWIKAIFGYSWLP